VLPTVSADGLLINLIVGHWSKKEDESICMGLLGSLDRRKNETQLLGKGVAQHEISLFENT